MEPPETVAFDLPYPVKNPDKRGCTKSNTITIKPYPIGVKIVFFRIKTLYTFKTTITPYTANAQSPYNQNGCH